MRTIFRPWAVPILGLLAFALVPACSDDPAGPAKNSGTPANNLTLSAGSYHLQLQLWTCGNVDTLVEEVDQVVCATTALNEILELDCPIKVNGDSLVIQCTQTRTDGAGCTYSQLFSGRGVKTATTWEFSGMYTLISESTPDCSGEPACGEFHMFIDRTGPAPPSCAYGAPGTITMTVTGGPLAGNVVMDAGGSAYDNGDGTIQFGLGGSYSTGTAGPGPGGNSTYQAISVYIPSVDPSALPQQLNLQVTSFPLRSTVRTGKGTSAVAGGGGNDAIIDQFFESRDTPLHSFYAESGSGSMVVQQASMDGVAGTLSFDATGTQTNSGGSATVSRSVTGSFNIVTQEPGGPKFSLRRRK